MSLPLIQMIILILNFASNSDARRLIPNTGPKEDIDTDSGGGGPEYDDYRIKIWVDYNWKINDTVEYYDISYALIADDMTDLIRGYYTRISWSSSGEGTSVKDVTSNKQDLIYYAIQSTNVISK